MSFGVWVLSVMMGSHHPWSSPPEGRSGAGGSSLRAIFRTFISLGNWLLSAAGVVGLQQSECASGQKLVYKARGRIL